jgi:UDP-N-acetylmuramate dehydrogenase
MSWEPRRDVSLQPFHSFAIDARARWFSRVTEPQDLARLREAPALRGVPWLVLGAGTNVVFTRDFDGLVVQVGMLGVREAGEDGGDALLEVGAGESWPLLVERLVREGRGGLENLALIPGSAGAAPVQNIGAYGVEVAERLHSVRVWDCEAGGERTLATEECGLGYRDSAFRRDAPGARVITSITLRLARAWRAVTGYAELERELARRGHAAATPADVFEAVCDLRRRKLPDPAVLGNAGSFFKNPIVAREQHASLLERFPSIVSYPLAGGRFKLAAGWLIEACGLKGATRGRAGVYERQALVLVNRGGASGGEVLALAAEVQERVRERFGVALEPEAIIV